MPVDASIISRNLIVYLEIHSIVSKWIVILQEFDLEFIVAKSKKSLVFADLICSLPLDSPSSRSEEYIPYDTLFLISTLDPWYSDIIVYLQTSTLISELTKDARRRIRH